MADRINMLKIICICIRDVDRDVNTVYVLVKFIVMNIDGIYLTALWSLKNIILLL